MKKATVVIVMLFMATMVFGQSPVTTGSDVVSELIGLSLNQLQNKLGSNFKIVKDGDVYMVRDYPTSAISMFTIDNQKGVTVWRFAYQNSTSELSDAVYKMLLDQLTELYGKPMSFGKSQVFMSSKHPANVNHLELERLNPTLVEVTWYATKK